MEHRPVAAGKRQRQQVMEMKKEEKRQRQQLMETKKADWSDLPKDILGLAMEKLYWSERVPLCLVCKSWHQCYLEIKNTQEFLPWVMCFNHHRDDESGICTLSDPSTNRNYTVKDAAIVKIKDFLGAEPCDAKYGWVLFSKRINGSPTMKHLFFYNPFINQVIQLPELEIYYLRVAFSLSPTSADCMVIAFFTAVSERLLRIKICHPGDEYWTTFELLCGVNIFIRDVVYAGDSFYCTFNDMSPLSEELHLGVLNVKQRRWKRILSPLPLTQPLLSLVLAFNEDLLLYKQLQRGPDASVWRLNLPEEKWVVLEDESLKKHVFFYCRYCPSFTVPAIGNARNSAGRERVLSDHAFLIEKYGMRAIWIQPPFPL